MTKHTHLGRFVEIIARLRGPGGCPWDREQTHQSLKPYLLEETYEVLEAIDKNKPERLKEELGDLLLQVVLHAQIAQDNGEFDIEAVAKMIGQKMVRRHPHVFGDKEAKTADDVTAHWDEIKREEKAANGIVPDSLLDAIPKNLPALFEAHKISKKAAKHGFDWWEVDRVFEKIEEEVRKVKTAIEENDKTHIHEELGDLLFAVAHLCRLCKINPELALKDANKKFRNRFKQMEDLITHNP